MPRDESRSLGNRFNCRFLGKQEYGKEYGEAVRLIMRASVDVRQEAGCALPAWSGGARSQRPSMIPLLGLTILTTQSSASAAGPAASARYPLSTDAPGHAVDPCQNPWDGQAGSRHFLAAGPGAWVPRSPPPPGSPSWRGPHSAHR